MLEAIRAMGLMSRRLSGYATYLARHCGIISIYFRVRGCALCIRRIPNCAIVRMTLARPCEIDHPVRGTLRCADVGWIHREEDQCKHVPRKLLEKSGNRAAFVCTDASNNGSNITGGCKWTTPFIGDLVFAEE